MFNELPVILHVREVLGDFDAYPMFNIILFVVIPLILLISAFALWKIFSHIKRLEAQTRETAMRKISKYIQAGAKVYLKDQSKMLIYVSLILFIPVGLNGLQFLDNPWFSFLLTGLIFMVGALSSLVASYVGMTAATRTNILVVENTIKDPNEGFKTAYFSGMITGILNISMFIVGIWLILILTRGNVYLMVSYDFGASVASLLAQVGGGIYTKSADMGADLVGKYEMNIPEDDPRNPAIVADLVGDNVGDCAARGADLFESAASDAVGGMVLGLSLFIFIGDPIYIISDITLISLGLLSLYFSILFLKIDFEKPSKSIWRVFIASTAFNVIVLLIVNLTLFGKSGIWLFIASLFGLGAAFLTIIHTIYYTNMDHKPTQNIAKVSENSPALNVLAGLTSGLSAVFVPLLIFVVSIIFTDYLGNKYAQELFSAHNIANSGVDIFGNPINPTLFFLAFGIWGVNMASISSDIIISTILSFDTFGPIMDNAAGLAEMGQEDAPPDLRKNLDKLDSVGNTTKAVAKGFALICGGFSSIVMFLTFLLSASTLAMQLPNSNIPTDELINIFDNLDIMNPLIITGFAIGVGLPVIFTGMVLKAVQKGANRMVDEVKHQFETIPGLLQGKEGVEPDYAECIDISAKNSLRNMVKPVMVIVVIELLTGILMGPMVIAALMIGNLISCLVFGLFMSISGGAMDNAKKGIEDGLHGGKGSLAHKAAIIGDTVGDPLKDVAGPSMNILITTINTLALTFLPIFIMTGYIWNFI